MKELLKVKEVKVFVFPNTKVVILKTVNVVLILMDFLTSLNASLRVTVHKRRATIYVHLIWNVNLRNALKVVSVHLMKEFHMIKQKLKEVHWQLAVAISALNFTAIISHLLVNAHIHQVLAILVTSQHA